MLFAQCFLLQDVVNFAAGSTSSQGISEDQRGTGLILATAIVFFGKSLSTNLFNHFHNQLDICLRGILSTAIYEKTLALPASETEELASVTLIAADLQGIEYLVSVDYNSWALLIETSIGIAVLSIFVGPASVLSLASVTFVTILARYMAARMLKARKVWNENMSTRVASTSNVLAQIRDLKMLGLAPSTGVHLKSLYSKEMEVAINDRKMMSLNFGITSLAETSAPMLVIAGALFWTRADHTISTARFFTILTISSLVADQWSTFLRQLLQWATGFAPLSRVQDYLEKDEAQDFRSLLGAPQDVLSDKLTPSFEPEEKTNPLAIKMQNVIVCMDEKAGPILKNTTVLINAGEITMLYGTVGCGKSTFLRSLLGEVLLGGGSVSLSSLSVAYAGQQPWLLNTTIRINIIGHKAYNAVLYQKVVRICALDVDFEQLPEGDETIAGNAGASLSGGQKQRVSIARALYFEAEVTVLDDPFSALDKETSALVRSRLLTDGNATAGGKTLVMSTSMREHLMDAQRILHVTDSGQVNEVSLEEAVAHPEDFVRELPAQKKSEAEDDGRSEKLPTVKGADEEENQEIAQEKRESNDISLYTYYLAPAGVVRVIVFLILNTFSAVAEMLPSIYARIWYGNDPSNKLYYIGFAIASIYYPVAISSGAVFYYFMVHIKTSTGLHDDLVKSTFGATYEFLMNEDAGSILNRFSQDMAMASQQVAMWILPTCFRAVSVLICIGTISAGATYAAAIIPFFLLLTLSIQQYYLRTSRQLRVLELETANDMMRHLTETAHGIEHIRAFRWQTEVTEPFHAVFGITQRPKYFLSCVQQWLEGVLDFSTGLAAIVVVSFAVKFPHTASASSMGLSMLALINFSSIINQFIMAAVAMETALGAVSRIRSYVATTPTEGYQPGPAVSKEWPDSGRITFSSVSAVYKPRKSAPFSPTKDVNAVIKPGETLGLVGRTGSGKSTILLSILNLLEYTGTIHIDGREIRTLPPDDLRARITALTQSGIQLRGSVRYNLAPFEPGCFPATYTMTDAMQEDALRRVGLWEVMAARDGDLDTDMKDMKLSHGQKQLFQFARAILHRQATGSRVLLMDEGTASMDEETEKRMHELLVEEFAGCTKIIISHRPSTLKGADAIMTLKDGKATIVNQVSEETLSKVAAESD